MKINLTCPINDLGYGTVGREIWKKLSNQNEVSLFPIGPISIDEQYSIQLINDINRPFYNSSPSIKIFHEFALIDFPGTPRIGFPIFELDDFPLKINGPFKIDVKNVLKQCDYLFVASNWAKQVLLNHQILSSDNIFVVPFGVDTNIFKPKISDKPIFLSVGKIEIRKGMDILIEAFDKAFDKDVELWMMWDNPFLSQQEVKEWEKYYKSFKCANRIKFIPRVKTHFEVAQIMQQVKVGVFPYRAEGWNLELLEMMACGKPVIATNYSGPTQYINDKNCILLEPIGMEEAYDGKWFFGGGKWAKLSIDELIEKMRLAYTTNKINEAGIKTAKYFTWEKTATTITRIIENETKCKYFS